jgi:hypothetical protein
MPSRPPSSHVIDGDFNLDSRLNRDGGDLLDNLSRRLKINQTLVDAHFETVPAEQRSWHHEHENVESKTCANMAHKKKKTKKQQAVKHESLPGLRTLSVGGLTGGDAQNLGRHTHGSLDLELLLLGATDQVGADLLQVANVARCEGDPNPMNWRRLGFLHAGLGGRLNSGGHSAGKESTLD